MELRAFGSTGMRVSTLTFGCGAVGGLMTRGDAADQNRTVAMALDAGINIFDTAPSYGDGSSETNLGRALGKRRADVFVTTKVRIGPDDRKNIAQAVRTSLDASLTRLGCDHVDLFQLHNLLSADAASGNAMTTQQVLGEVIPVFEELRVAGKTRFLGFTARGDTASIHELVKSGHVHGAQVFYNALNPSAGETLPANYPAHDYRNLLDVAHANGVGSIGVRILAGGALSGSEARHPLGTPSVDPIGSGRDYAADVARARRLQPMIDEGHAASLPETAVRFAIANQKLPTIEVGIATYEEFALALDAVNKGPLSPDALTRLRELQRAFSGEAR